MHERVIAKLYLPVSKVVKRAETLKKLKGNKNEKRQCLCEINLEVFWTMFVSETHY